MPDSSVGQVLRESIEAVLEKMFFVQCLGEARESVPEPELTAHLSFQGSPSGALTLRITKAVAQSIAADFLGVEASELSERQVEDVLCELANMICGSVLSRLEPASTFRLSVPSVIPCDSPRLALSGNSTAHAVEIGCGRLMVTIQAETPAWQPAAR